MAESKHQPSRSIYPSIRKALAILLSQSKYDLQEAAIGAGLTTQKLREYLARPAVRTYLRNERRTQIEALCASNANALARVRDEAENSMAVVNAVRQAETMRARIIEEDGPTGMARPTAGLIIVIGGNAGGRDVVIEPAAAPRIEDGAFLRRPDKDDDLLAGDLDDEALDVLPPPVRAVKPARRK
jgi:hypothetical protein